MSTYLGTGGTFFGLLGGVGGACSATTTTASGLFNQQYANATTAQTSTYWMTQAVGIQQQALAQFQQMQFQQSRKLQEGEYELPDGALLVIDSLGNYKVHDEHAKVIYRACRMREFNPYINASDLLEAFINEAGLLDGVDQGDVLGLPIEAFINWIILQAAKRDGDPLDGLPSVEAALVKRLPVAIPHIPASTEEASAP